MGVYVFFFTNNATKKVAYCWRVMRAFSTSESEGTGPKMASSSPSFWAWLSGKKDGNGERLGNGERFILLWEEDK